MKSRCGAARRKSRRASTYIEALVAGLLLAVGMMALVNVWAFSLRVTVNTDDESIAYNLGRFALERVKQSGFATPEGTSATYYDDNQNVVSQAAARFQVTTGVVSDLVKSGTPGQSGAVPANGALRTVTVTVDYASGGGTLFQENTYLARGGI